MRGRVRFSEEQIPDNELEDHIVKWPGRGPNVLMPDGRGFYPDFLIGINGRKAEEGVMLADPKFGFQRDEEAAKVLAEHRAYGRVMILYLDGFRWMTVGYDAKAQKPVLMREFRLSDAAAF